MPIYEYRCDSCNQRFSRLVRDYRQAGQVLCDRCGVAARKLMSTFAAFNEDSEVWTTDDAIAERESPPIPPRPVLGRKELNESSQIRAVANKLE